MKWEFDSERPIYLQVVEILQGDILSGKYAPEDKFPSVRELAVEAGVNPNTMQKALAELERQGFLISLGTVGKIVTDDVAKIQNHRLKLADEKIQSFMAQMKSLGFTKTEVADLVREQAV